MTDSNPHDPIPNDRQIMGIQALGESHRTPEYKQGRDTFVEVVNGFLSRMKVVQEQTGLLEVPGGLTLPISEESRITETNLGTNNLGLRSVVVNTEGGISLVGDGEFSPLTFQAVLPNDGNGNPLMVEISGTNPMLPKDETGEYTRKSRTDGDFAILKLETTITEADSVRDKEETYRVMGDGSVQVSIPKISDTELHSELAVRGMEQGVAVINRLTEIFKPVEQ